MKVKANKNVIYENKRTYTKEFQVHKKKQKFTLQ